MGMITRVLRTRRGCALALLFMMFVTCTIAMAEGRHVEKRVAPVYPELARRMHISGSVKVSATVATDGSVTDAKATSGNQMLTSAAEEAVKKWRFSQAESASSEVVEVTFIESN